MKREILMKELKEELKTSYNTYATPTVMVL